MDILKRVMNRYHGLDDMEKEPPTGGIQRVGYVMRNYPGKLFFINLIFIISCLPIVTIPAAVMALNHYIMKIFRKGYDFTFDDYKDEFKASLKKGIPLGMLIGLLCFYGYYLLSLAGNFTDGNIGALVTGIGAAVLMFGVLLGTYVFVLAAMLELPGRHLLKNALLLMLMEWKANLLILLTFFLGFNLVIAFFPYSLYVVFSGLFAILQLIICAILNPIVNRRILEPYEKQNG